MEAIYKDDFVTVWQISKVAPQPQWVQEAFERNYFQWIDNQVRILMVGLNADAIANTKIGLVVSAAGGGFAGYHMYQNAYIGDYYDATNHKIVSAHYFAKHYQVKTEKR